jgi:hypothetical protein
MSPVALAFLGFLFLAILFVGLAILSSQSSRRKREKVLFAHGFEACELKEEKKRFTKELSFLNSRHQGPRLLMSLYRRPLQDSKAVAYVGEYHFASAGGRTSGAEWTLVFLKAAGLNLPRVILERVPTHSATLRRLHNVLSQSFPMGNLAKLEDNDVSMSVYVDPSQKDLAVTKTLAQAIKTAGNFDFDLFGDYIVIVKVKGPASQGPGLEDLEQQVQALLKVYAVAVEARR